MSIQMRSLDIVFKCLPHYSAILYKKQLLVSGAIVVLPIYLIYFASYIKQKEHSQLHIVIKLRIKTSMFTTHIQ